MFSILELPSRPRRKFTFWWLVQQSMLVIWLFAGVIFPSNAAEISYEGPWKYAAVSDSNYIYTSEQAAVDAGTKSYQG